MPSGVEAVTASLSRYRVHDTTGDDLDPVGVTFGSRSANWRRVGLDPPLPGPREAAAGYIVRGVAARISFLIWALVCTPALGWVAADLLARSTSVSSGSWFVTVLLVPALLTVVWGVLARFRGRDIALAAALSAVMSFIALVALLIWAGSHGAFD